MGVSRVVMRMMMICPGVAQLVENGEGKKEGRKRMEKERRKEGNRYLRGIGHRPTNGRPHNKESLGERLNFIFVRGEGGGMQTW